MPGGRPKSDTRLRFLEKAKKMESGCHEWQARVNRGGYGMFSYDQKNIPAHRASYLLFNGQIPPGACVLHRCDNRKCVNPEHLFIGTQKDNISDMDLKQRRGTKSALTYTDVEEIKKLLSERYSQETIAKKFNIHQGTISRIKLGKTTLFKLT